MLQRCEGKRAHLADVASKMSFLGKAVVVDLEQEIEDVVLHVSCIKARN
jgi:hypothetical protein